MSFLDLAKDIQVKKLNFENSIEAFKSLYMASRNLASRTRTEYLNDLRQLVKFLEKRKLKGPQEVSLSDLQAYLAYLDEKKYAGITRRRKTSTIKSYFGFLTQQGLIGKDPSLELIPPAIETKEPRFLSKQEYQALLRACSHNLRDAAVIELLLQTGMRLSEVSRLTLYDVKLPKKINRDPMNTGTISIKGKGRKDRRLPLNYKACRAIKNWLRIRPDIAEPALFVTKFREPMGPRAIQRLVEKYLKEAGIRDASVHTLRHTFATQHIAKGTKLRSVQEALGHADLKTTSIYSHLVKERLQKDLQDHAL